MRGVEGRVGGSRALGAGSPRVQRPKSQRGRSRAPGHPARQHGARRGGLCLTDSSVGGSAGYVGAGAAAPLLDNEAEVNATIDAILEGIKGTDSGASVSADKRKVIDGNIEKLIELSARQSSPLDNPGIFANYTVAYTSPGPKQNGAPAGGRFRGKLGRLLFRTEGLYQAILKPNLAKNLVTFWLFGLIPGSIGLTGTFVKLDKSIVKVVFERPRLTILGQTVSSFPLSTGLWAASDPPFFSLSLSSLGSGQSPRWSWRPRRFTPTRSGSGEVPAALSSSSPSTRRASARRS